MMKLQRLSERPILTANPRNDWEKGCVFNPTAIYDNGIFHLLYRAGSGAANGGWGFWQSSIGYAVSEDGVNFSRLDRPVLRPNEHPQETIGVEDPRLTKIGDTYYLFYTGWNGSNFRICQARSKNLITWERHGIMFDYNNKNGALFPEQIGGRYCLMHRRDNREIWLSYSDDLLYWTDDAMVLGSIPGTWEDGRIRISGPPIKTPQGWFIIYNGVHDADQSRRLGAALLDLKDPTRVLARQKEPLLEPERDWELHGYYHKVLFSCGHAVRGDDLYVYYGACDQVIGVAAMRLSDIHF